MLESAGDRALGRPGGWLDRRRPIEMPSAGLSGLLPDTGVRRALAGIWKPKTSALSVRETDSNGESGRLWLRASGAGISSPHGWRSYSPGPSFAVELPRRFSASACAWLNAASVLLREVRRVLISSLHVSSSCLAIASEGWRSWRSSSSRRQRLAC